MGTSEIRRVGFIGLGCMGKPMARNLLKAGYELTVASRSPAPVEELKAEGARVATTPREVAEASDLVITMLPNSPDVEQVCCGANGTGDDAESLKISDPIIAANLSGRSPSLIVVDMSTISPQVSIAIGERLSARGIRYMEAPVSGGDVGAISGALSIMTGGSEEVFNAVLPVMRVLGKSIVRVGDLGAGQTTKLANNIICATTIEAVAEAFVFGAKAGIDPEKMFEAIRSGAAQCWSMDLKVPKIVKRDFEPGFKIKLHVKDLRLALDAGREIGAPLPITEKVCAMLEQLEAEGHGEEDNGALVKALEKLAGVEVRSVTA